MIIFGVVGRSKAAKKKGSIRERAGPLTSTAISPKMKVAPVVVGRVERR
jgi:hypothetical protein